jgi:ATP-dependent DNA helicase HFM1/MER3
LRFIGISATVPNVKDIAAWLGDSYTKPAQCKVFGEEHRPVKLTVEVLGYNFGANCNDWAFDTKLNETVSDVIKKHNPTSRPTLVFCSTRNACKTVATKIKERGLSYTNHLSATQQMQLGQDAQRFKNKDLVQLVAKGLGFHHGGLDLEDRQLIEKLFLKGHVSVLTCTSTLAVGVNLPAYLVVIKGTNVYREAAMHDYSEAEVIQMCGRAGRPQFEKEGKAVIMTQRRNVAKYEDAWCTFSDKELHSRMPLDLTHVHFKRTCV